MPLLRDVGQQQSKAAKKKTSTMEIQEKCSNNSLFLTVQQTAELLQVSQKSVYRLLNRGLLKASPYLRHKLISRKSVVAFSEACT